MTETLTLVYVLETYETLPSDKLDKKSKCRIYLNDNLIGTVASPSYDGARLLLKLGFDPDTLMTTQAQDSAHPSWKPQPLYKWAKLSTQELDHRQVRVRTYTECPRVGVSEGVSPLCDTTYLNHTTPLYAAPVATL